MSKWTAPPNLDAAVIKAVEAAAEEARAMIAALRRMAGEAERVFQATDFRFLLDLRGCLYWGTSTSFRSLKSGSSTTNGAVNMVRVCLSTNFLLL